MENTKTSARNWLGTYNNPPDEQFIIEYLEKWQTTGKAVYVVGQMEKAPETGTIHIQFYLNFKNETRLSALKKFCSHSHFTPVKKDNGAAKYCMKPDSRVSGPWEFGIKPVERNSKTDWEEVKKHAQEGQLDKIPAQIYVKHYRTLKEIAKDHLVHNRGNAERDCRWYHGPSGIGKSRKAYEEFPDAYRKMCNKWWDGYQGQKAVILEDIDPGHSVLGHHLKIWADRYPFVAESKGGALPPEYDVFIVTSQYAPEEIFQDNATVQAIRRRFKVTKFLEFPPRDLQGPCETGIIAQKRKTHM